MKKLTLLAAAIFAAGAANAQYVGDPALSKTTEVGAKYDVVLLDNASIESLTAAGKTVQDLRTDDVNIFLYVWNETFTGGDGSYPGVDMQMDGYTSLDVTSVGWSGAGFCLVNKAADFKHFTDNTHFHCGVRSTNAPASIAIIVGDGYKADNDQDKWSPAKVSIGKTAFVDNGVTYPLVGALSEDGDWVAIDVTLGQLKKLFPSFSYDAEEFKGNIVSFLAGGVSGTNVCLDAVYFYTPAAGSVEGIAADKAEIIVSGKTISAVGADQIAVYNVAGQLVKKADASIVGTEDLAAGIYVVKAGNAVKKVVLK